MAINLRFPLGAANSNSIGVTYAYPPWMGGEFLLLIIADANGGVTTTPSGWTLIGPVGTGTANGATSTAIRAYYKFAVAGETPSSVAVADLGDNQGGFISAWTGVDTTTPLDVAVVSDTAASSTSVTMPSITTVTNGAMVLFICSNSNDVATQQGSGHAAAGLASIGTLWEQTTSGGGSGWDLIYGEKTTAGATGTATMTLASASLQARLTIALRPNQQGSAAKTTKIVSYALSSLALDKAAFSKFTGYAATSLTLNKAAFSKFVGYALTSSMEIEKALGYAVIGGPDGQMAVEKALGYAVIGGLTSAMAIEKVVGYAIIDGTLSTLTTQRPVVFVAT